jgi:hypothetical protein
LTRGDVACATTTESHPPPYQLDCEKLRLAIEEGAKVREVRLASWGCAMADVNIPKPGEAPFRMSAFLVAVPGPSGLWSVVAVNYRAL